MLRYYYYLFFVRLPRCLNYFWRHFANTYLIWLISGTSKYNTYIHRVDKNITNLKRDLTVDTLLFICHCCLKLLSYSKYIYFSLFSLYSKPLLFFESLPFLCWVVQVRCVTIIKLNHLSFLSFILLLFSLFTLISFKLFRIHYFSLSLCKI